MYKSVVEINDYSRFDLRCQNGAYAAIPLPWTVVSDVVSCLLSLHADALHGSHCELFPRFHARSKPPLFADAAWCWADRTGASRGTSLFPWFHAHIASLLKSNCLSQQTTPYSKPHSRIYRLTAAPITEASCYWPHLISSEQAKRERMSNEVGEGDRTRSTAPRLPLHGVAGNTLGSTPRPTPADPALSRAALVEE